MKPWPKLFQNLRSSRQTELAERYPIQVVCEWIGNSEAVAAKHYLQVTEDHVAAALRTRQFLAPVVAAGRCTRGSVQHDKTKRLELP